MADDKSSFEDAANVLDRLKNELSTDNEVNLESPVGRRLPSLRNAIQEYDQWRGLSMQRTTDKNLGTAGLEKLNSRSGTGLRPDCINSCRAMVAYLRTPKRYRQGPNMLARAHSV
jgi:hypothetical protein